MDSSIEKTDDKNDSILKSPSLVTRETHDSNLEQVQRLKVEFAQSQNPPILPCKNSFCKCSQCICQDRCACGTGSNIVGNVTSSIDIPTNTPPVTCDPCKSFQVEQQRKQVGKGLN